MTSIPHFVYELVDPRDNSIFYVGISINLYNRFRQHMHCDGTNVQKDQRIQDILASGHLPIMRTIDRAESFEQAKKREKWWMWERLNAGSVLVNIDRFNLSFYGSGIGVASTKTVAPGTKERTYVSVINMLVSVHKGNEWPDNVSEPMRRHYQRKYPEFFHNGKQWDKQRKERIAHVAKVTASNMRRGRKI